MVALIGHGTRRALMAGLILLLLGALPGQGWGQAATLYFLTIKKGVSDPSASGDTLFETLAQDHGTLQDEREVEPVSLELDIYGVSGGRFGLGIGIEVLQYDDFISLPSGARVDLRVKGVLFTLKTFLRLGAFFPFVGLGIGNYYANLDLPSGPSLPGGLSLRDSPDDVFNARAGLRVLLGRLGLLVEVGNTAAQLDVPSLSGPATLELGGTYTNVGLSWVF